MGLFWVLMLAALAAIYFYWNNVISQDKFTICSAVTYTGALVLFILLLSFVPYFNKKISNQEFLTYNREFFTIYVFSALLSLIAFSALSLALLAIDNLFEVSIPGKTYGHLATLLGGIAWTFLFLSRFPKDYNDNHIQSYPAFRIIIQFIGIPVIVVYAVILLFYALKNVFGSSSHEEWVLWLILWFYILSFLIFCLNYSIKDDVEYKWSSWFCKWYLIGAIPISAFNLIGSWKTIDQNGVTELSFIIATFSLFLLLVSIYLLFSKNKDFRLVPGFLFVLTAVSVFGPLNMCSSSIRSQTDKLQTTLNTHGMLVQGALVPGTNLSARVNNDIFGSIHFLNNRGAIEKLKAWDTNNLLGNDPLVIEEVLVALNIDGGRNMSLNTNFIQGERDREIEVEGYSKIIPVFSPFSQDKIEGTYITFDPEEPVMYIKTGSKKVDEVDYLRFLDFTSLRENKYIEIETDLYQVKLYFNFLDIDNNNFITNIEGMALLKNKSSR